MSECLRESSSELYGYTKWHSCPYDTQSIPSLENMGRGICKRNCISDPMCKMWAYNEDTGECQLSSSDARDMTSTKNEWSSGRIRCETQYDFVSIITWAMVLTFIFVAVWWFTKPCSK